MLASANPGLPTPDDRLIDLDRYVNVQTRDGQDPGLTLIVAISGGGYRAANFALGALLALEQIGYGDDSNLLNEVDYFSTVSGGGIAAALSLAARLNATGKSQTPLLDWVHCTGTLESLRHNNTIKLVYYKFKPGVLLTQKTSGDEFQVWLDRTLLQKRNNAAELCDVADPDRSYVLGDIFEPATDAGAGKAVVPYWFMNATDIATGRIFPFTPARLEADEIRDYWHPGTEALCRSGHCDYWSVPIAVGLRSSMNFPAGIPATRLVRREGSGTRFLYLTDGGESDNLGAVVATEILSQEPIDRPKRRLVIVIDAFRGLGPGNYDKPRPPGLFASVLRATSLPLDAHRLRVKASFYDARRNHPTVLDALSAEADVSVAYVRMDDEPVARRVGTTLHLGRDQQQELLCAGKRRALAALGMAELWPEKVRDSRKEGAKSADELSCHDVSIKPRCSATDRAQGYCPLIVAFNSQSKRALQAGLTKRLEDTVHLARNAVGDLVRGVEGIVRRGVRAHYEDDVRRRFNYLLKDSVGRPQLAASDLNDLRQTMDAYIDSVNQMSGTVEIAMKAVREEVGGDDNNRPPSTSIFLEIWNGASEAVQTFVSYIVDVLRGLVQDVPKEEEEQVELPEEQTDPEERTESGERQEGDEVAEGQASGRSIADEDVTWGLAMVSDGLKEMGRSSKEIERLLRTEDPGDEELYEKLQRGISGLHVGHRKLTSGFARLESGGMDDLYNRLRELIHLLEKPSAGVSRIPLILNKKFRDALATEADRHRQLGEFEKELEGVSDRVEGDFGRFEDAPVHQWLQRSYDALDAIGAKWVARVGPGQSGLPVCEAMQRVVEDLWLARRVLQDVPALADTGAPVSADLSEAWGLGPILVADLDWKAVNSQLTTAMEQLGSNAAEVRRLSCIWPDSGRRDSIDYRAFVKLKPLGQYGEKGCDELSELPYVPACPKLPRSDRWSR